jgi:hypothetical protein
METAMLKVLLYILQAVDRSNIAALALLNLYAAFDMVNHATLLRQLDVLYGLLDMVLQGFKSYIDSNVFVAGSPLLHH